MRGAFNTTCDLFFGPISPFGTPYLQYAAALPCRFVPQRQIDQQDFPLSLTNAWMTLDAVNPHTPQYISRYLSQWEADIFTADIVNVASNPGVNYYPIRSEFVHPFGQPSYYRVELLNEAVVNFMNWLPPSPLPTPFLTGSCFSAVQIFPGVLYTAAPALGFDGWGRFLAIKGQMYMISVSASSDPAAVTQVLSGPCGSQVNIAPNVVGMGATMFMCTQTGWVYVECSSLVGSLMSLMVM